VVGLGRRGKLLTTRTNHNNNNNKWKATTSNFPHFLFAVTRGGAAEWLSIKG